MQWVKRFWDQNFPGGEYDAVGRRKGGGAVKHSSPAPTRGAVRKTAPVSSSPAGKKKKIVYGVFISSIDISSFKPVVPVVQPQSIQVAVLQLETIMQLVI